MMDLPFVIISEHITNYVKTACCRPENVFSNSFYEQHILLVAGFADQLCRICNADPEIVWLASMLHDIAAIEDFKTLSVHNIESALIAERLLRERGYPEEKIIRVKDAIIRHPVPVPAGMGAPEEICVSNADAMSQIVNPAYWFYYTYKVRSMTFQEGCEWYKNKVRSNWNNIIGPAKEMIENRYVNVSKLFN